MMFPQDFGCTLLLEEQDSSGGFFSGLNAGEIGGA